MAGRGPAPKRDEDRARRNTQAQPLKLIKLMSTRIVQPELPEFSMPVEVDGEIIEQPFEWPQRTRQWWAMWRDSELSKDFTDADWDFLLDTALIHARYWRGALSLAPELRLRVAKFGQTPEDRLRLRIAFAPRDEGLEPPATITSSSSRSRRRQQRSVG